MVVSSIWGIPKTRGFSFNLDDLGAPIILGNPHIVMYHFLGLFKNCRRSVEKLRRNAAVSDLLLSTIAMSRAGIAA